MTAGAVDLTVTVNGFDGSNDNYQISKTSSSTSNVRIAKWRVPVDSASEVTLITFAATATGSAFTGIGAAVFINQDSTNFIRIRAKDDTAHAADFKVPAGRPWILNTQDINVSATSGAFSSFSTIDTVAAQANTADANMDVYIYHA